MGEAFKTACTHLDGRPTGPHRGSGVEPPATSPLAAHGWVNFTRRRRQYSFDHRRARQDALYSPAAGPPLSTVKHGQAVPRRPAAS